jgi:hypothetical protein
MGVIEMKSFELDPADVPIYGAEAFARVLNRTPRQVFADLENGRLDGHVKKFGKRWVSTPRRLLASLEPTPVDTDSAA